MEEFVQGKFVRDIVFFLPCNLDLCLPRLQNVPLLFWIWKGSGNRNICYLEILALAWGKYCQSRAGCFVAGCGWALCDMLTELWRTWTSSTPPSSFPLHSSRVGIEPYLAELIACSPFQTQEDTEPLRLWNLNCAWPTSPLRILN